MSIIKRSDRLQATHKYTLLLKNIKIDCQIVNVALFVLSLGQSTKKFYQSICFFLAKSSKGLNIFASFNHAVINNKRLKNWRINIIQR